MDGGCPAHLILSREVPMNAHLIAAASSQVWHAPSPQADVLFGGALYVMLGLAAFNLALVYNMWRVLVRGGQARCSPGAATGLLLVPGVNVIWLFVAFVGWAKDYNRTLEANNLDLPPIPERTMWAYILATLLPAPGVSQLVQARCLVVIWKAMRRMNEVGAQSFS